LSLASSSHRPGAVAIIAVVMLASSRTSRWRCCHRHVGIVAVAALTSSSRWHRCPRPLADTVAIVSVAVLASSRTSRWRGCQRHSSTVVALAASSLDSSSDTTAAVFAARLAFAPLGPAKS
jgi:hypothetical protein